MELFGLPVVERDLGPMPQLKVLDWSQWATPNKPGYYLAFSKKMQEWEPVQLFESHTVMRIGSLKPSLATEFSHWIGPFTVEGKPE